MSKSKVVAVLAFVTAAGLFMIPAFTAQDYECSECVMAEDCGDGLRCSRFDDGISRCVSSEYVCTQGHIKTGGTWTHLAAIAAFAVGALAVSFQVTQKRLSREGDDS